MTQYRIFHPLSHTYVVPKKPSEHESERTAPSYAEGTELYALSSSSARAPSYGELIFSAEKVGEDSYFELIPDPANKKWFHIKHVKDGMYVTRGPKDTLMLSGTEPADLFKYKERKKRIKCKPPPRKAFWYGDNPLQGTPVEVNVLDKKAARKPAFRFILEKVKH